MNGKLLTEDEGEASSQKDDQYSSKSNSFREPTEEQTELKPPPLPSVITVPPKVGQVEPSLSVDQGFVPTSEENVDQFSSSLNSNLAGLKRKNQLAKKRFVAFPQPQ